MRLFSTEGQHRIFSVRTQVADLCVAFQNGPRHKIPAEGSHGQRLVAFLWKQTSEIYSCIMQKFYWTILWPAEGLEFDTRLLLVRGHGSISRRQSSSAHAQYVSVSIRQTCNHTDREHSVNTYLQLPPNPKARLEQRGHKELQTQTTERACYMRSFISNHT